MMFMSKRLQFPIEPTSCTLFCLWVFLPGLRDLTGVVAYWAIALLLLGGLLSRRWGTAPFPAVGQTMGWAWVLFAINLVLVSGVSPYLLGVAGKYLLMGLLAWGLVRAARHDDILLINAALAACLVLAALLALSVLHWHPLLALGPTGDHRIGFQLAKAGSLYIPAAYVFGIGLLDQVGRRRIRGGIWWCMLAALLVHLDGSRTGLLWLVLILLLAWCIDIRHHRGRSTGLLLWLSAWTLGAVWINFNPAEMARLTEFWTLSDGQEGPQWSQWLAPRRGPQTMASRLEMWRVALDALPGHLPWGGGWQATRSSFGGEYHLVIHMAYLQVLSDLGVVGLLGFLLVFTPLWRMIWLFRHQPLNLLVQHPLLTIPAFLLFSSLFNPLSNELSEWGLSLWVLAMLSHQGPPRAGQAKPETDHARVT